MADISSRSPLHIAITYQPKISYQPKTPPMTFTPMNEFITDRPPTKADGPAVPEGREPASVVGEPSDEELLALLPQSGSESDFYLPKGLPSDWVDGDFIAPPEAVVAFARAILARFGHQPAPPAAGDVGVLLRELRDAAFDLNGSDPAKWMLTRAADLLEQRHPTPVPVSERLPGPEDCTAQGWCWVLYQGFATWTLEPPLGQDGKHTGYTHWLPANALPLPAGEGS